MANIMKKIDLTTEELEILRKTKQILEEIYNIADRNNLLDNFNYFDLTDYDYPEELVDILDIYNEKYSF